jgi:hypothetical protein
MKKLILSLILSVSVYAATNAQDIIYGGLKLSPNYSFFTEEFKKVSSGIGYSIGYFEVLELSNRINLQAELNYSSYAFVDNRVDDVKTTTRYNYLELPVMVKYRVSETFAIGAGYQLNLLNEVFKKGKVTSKFDGEEESMDLSAEEIIGTNGFFVDANVKGGNNIFGLRVLSTNDPLFEGKKSLNVALYVGFTLFK